MRIKLLTILALLLLSGAFAQHRPYSGQDLVDNQSEILPGESIAEKIKNNFFLRAEVSKRDCFVGEVIMASFKAYSRLDANSRVLKRPSLTGFSVIEMVDNYSSLPETEKLNDVFYNTHLIRKVQLFPLQPGDFTIEAAEIESSIHLYQERGSNAGARNGKEPRKARPYFRKRLLQKDTTFKTPPVTIHVKALPEKGQPSDFSGAVGQFRIHMRLTDTTIHQFQPAVAQLVISGTGNLPLITDPEINWPANLSVGPPQVIEELNKFNFPLTGAKVFQFSLPTPDTGRFTIPAIRFSFFDPDSVTYKEAETAPLVYTVLPSDEQTGIVNVETAKRPSFPTHYLYFGIIAGMIMIVIVVQVIRASRK
jgi:hypothetical protein